MRVIQLGKYYPPATGGIEHHTRTLCRGLADLGVQVDVVVVNHQDAAGRDVTFSRLARTHDAQDMDGSVRVYRVGRVANLAKLDVTPTLPRLLRGLNRKPPDLWHVHTPNVTMLAALAAMPGIRPLVITHHSDIVRQKVLRHGVRPLELMIYRRAVRLLSDSAAYALGSDLLSRMPQKVEALPLGIELNPYSQPNAAARDYAANLRQTYGTPIWLMVGRLVYYKAMEVALQALRRLPGRLLVVGTGPMEQRWKAEATAAGLSERVVWLGRVSGDQLIGAYHAATAFWFPSNARAEGFGLVQVEAMASGCPVVNAAIPHSGVPWVSQHEVSGLTVPVNDPASFAAACERILQEAGLRERLATGGRARAAAEFDHRVMAQRCLAIYERCLSGVNR